MEFPLFLQPRAEILVEIKIVAGGAFADWLLEGLAENR